MLVEQRAGGRDRRERPALDRRAGVGERRERGREGARDGGLDVVDEVAVGHDEARQDGAARGDPAAAVPGATPRSSASSTTASATLVVNGPALSSVGASATTPVRSTRAAVGLKPTSPQNAAGTRIEPDVSVPIAHGTAPAATATAEPEDEPPGMRAGSPPRGLRGVPKCGLSPSPEYASSLRFVLPTQTMPAAASRAAIGASVRAGGAPRRSSEPAVVGTPSTSIRSFSATGTPSSGPSGAPARSRAALAAASRRARAAVTAVKAAPASCARSSDSSASATGSSSPAASSRPSSSAPGTVRRRPRRAGSGGAARTASCAPRPGGRRGEPPRPGRRDRA